MYKSANYPFLYHFSIFDNFKDAMQAGMTGRQGGESRPPYGSFNTALHCGDETIHVINNRKILCSALSVDFESYTCSRQVHGSSIATVTSREKGAGRNTYSDAIAGTDGLITAEPGILLNIHLADCVPLILYDPDRKTGALSHAGWKGTANRIAEKAVHTMVKQFHCKEENIVSAIGPSIGSCCFEIGEDTAEKLTDSFPYRSSILKRREGRIFADLWKANREQLLSCGLKEENIETASICTSCHNEDFFSYRADKGTTGRFSAFLILK